MNVEQSRGEVSLNAPDDGSEVIDSHVVVQGLDTTAMALHAAEGVDAGLDGVLHSFMSQGINGLDRKHVSVMLNRAKRDLHWLHQTGQSLADEIGRLNLPVYLDYVKIATALTRQQQKGLMSGDNTDYRTWLLRWRRRGGKHENVTFEEVLELCRTLPPISWNKIHVLGSQVLMINTLEQLHRDRLSKVTKLKFDLLRMDALK